MKLIFLFALLIPVACYSTQNKPIPWWVRGHLNDGSIKSSATVAKPINFSLSEYHDAKVREEIAGNGFKSRIVSVSSTLLKSKRVSALDSETGYQWDYCAAHFKCEYPQSDQSFKVWVILGALEPDEDATERSTRLVDAETWEGLKCRVVGDSGFLVIDSTLVENPQIEVDGKLIHFVGSSCVRLNAEGNADVSPLPYRSNLSGKDVNGLMGSWFPFTSHYLVASMKTSVATLYGDRVTDVRFFFYDVKNKRMAQLPLTLNVATMVKQLPVIKAPDQEVLLVTEALERPIRVVLLKDGRRALGMYLPANEVRQAGRFLVIPKL